MLANESPRNPSSTGFLRAELERNLEEVRPEQVGGFRVPLPIPRLLHLFSLAVHLGPV